MVRVILFDRLGNPLGDLSEDEVFGLVRTEKVNGEHSLTITTTRILEQGWRVLTCDARGIWREHVVYGTDALHDSAERPFGSYYCVWSVQHDLMGTRVSAMPGVQNPTTAALALDAALGGTARWSRGTVTQTSTGGASMYDTDGWSAIATLVEVWGGELDTTIAVGGAGVVSRQVDLYDKQGEQTAKRRFDFGADVKSVRRKIADGPLYCRVTPRGRGEETEGGGYGRKVTIETVNDGKDYLVNSAMVDLAKLPDGNGGWEYPTREIENPDIESPAALKAWAQSVLEEYTVPKVTDEVDGLQLAREGVDMHGVSLGDAVQVVDRKFGGLRIAARVMQTTVNMLDESDAQLTLGQAADDLSTMLGGLGARLDAVATTVYNMNGGTYSTAGFLTRLLERLNEEINAGGGYAYITEGHGILCYDTAVSDPLVGAEASKAVEIKGGTIRIANTKTAQGAWEWKTVFTSGHIAAEMVTAANITAGYIGNAVNSSYWDIDNGQMVIRGGVIQATIGNTGVVTSDVMWKRYALWMGYSTVDAYGFEVKRPSIGSWIGIFPACDDDLDSSSGYHWGSIIASGRLVLAAYGNDTTSKFGFVKLDTNAAYMGVERITAGTPTKCYFIKDNALMMRYGIYEYVQVDNSGVTLYGATEVHGALSATGTKSRRVATEDYSDRLLYSYETPSPTFGDIGSGTLDGTGCCYVSIDDVFGETARTDIAYQVFLQACGPGELYVAEKSREYFVVRGEPGLAFDWEIKCKQTGYENLRLEDACLDGEDGYEGVDEQAYAEELDYIGQIERIQDEAA